MKQGKGDRKGGSRRKGHKKILKRGKKKKKKANNQMNQVEIRLKNKKKGGMRGRGGGEKCEKDFYRGKGGSVTGGVRDGDLLNMKLEGDLIKGKGGGGGGGKKVG